MSFESVAVSIEKKTVVVFEDVVHVGSDLFKVLETAEKLSPAFRSELTTILADIAPIAAALTPIIASEGSNVAADLAAIAPILVDLKKLAADFAAFLPTLTAAIGQLTSDVK
jgi:hypothetical protein